jgi:hypothetical protein
MSRRKYNLRRSPVRSFVPAWLTQWRIERERYKQEARGRKAKR